MRSLFVFQLPKPRKIVEKICETDWGKTFGELAKIFFLFLKVLMLVAELQNPRGSPNAFSPIFHIVFCAAIRGEIEDYFWGHQTDCFW